jgi:hypothetical protein
MFTFPALRNMDPSLEEADDISGASAQGWVERFAKRIARSFTT